jgi:hypothetical protein
MPIVRLLETCRLDAETAAVVTSVFETMRLELGLLDKRDPLTEALALKIIQAAEDGERDPHAIRMRTIEALGR